MKNLKHNIIYSFYNNNPTVNFIYLENGICKTYLSIMIKLELGFNVGAISRELITIDDMQALIYVYNKLPGSEIT